MADAAVAEATQPETQAAKGEAPIPRIHVPDETLGTEPESEDGSEPVEATTAPEQPKKKRTRRGSRGGRGRKKPAGNGAAAEPDGQSAPEAPQDAEEEEAEAEGGYVPMSEWIDDFERRQRR